MTMPSRLKPLIAVAIALFCTSALAQYRGKPLTADELLVKDGDAAVVDANEALRGGDKDEAKEKFNKALKLYQQALQKNPDSVLAANGYGLAAILIGDYQGILDVVGPVAQRHPDDIDVAYVYGYALFKLKRYEDAEPILAKVSDAMKPEQYLAHYFLGQYYLLMAQQADKAVTEYQRYLQTRPDRLAGHDGEIDLQIGRAYVLLKRPADARTAFQAAQAGHPEELPAQLGLESVLELEGRQKDAIALLDHLTSVFPDQPDPKAKLGRLLLASGDLSRAQQVAQNLVQLSSKAPSWLLLGEVKLAQKQPAEAEQWIRKAYQAEPSSTEAEIALANAVQVQGRNDEAIGLLEKAVAAGAGGVDVYAALGSTYRRAGRFQKAIAAHTKVVELAPTLARGQVLLGADHYATGEWDLAIADYDKALKREPNDANARHWLALSLAHRAKERATTDLDGAVRDLRRAFDLEATASIGKSLGAAMLSSQDYLDAKSVLTQAAQLADATWEEPFLLGYALLGTHEAAAAKTAFEKAGSLTQDPNATARIYAGWALSNIELGDFDTAVAKLTEEGNSAAAKITETNLPFALLRRALARLQQGQVDGARQDVEAAEKLAGKPSPDLLRIRTLVRALVDVEQGKYADASEGIRHALTGANKKWASPQARPLLEAYVLYREGQMAKARRALAKAERRATSEQKQWGVLLTRAIDRRDGEQSFTHHNLREAEKALKSAIAAEPLNPFVINNLACVDYAKRRWGKAVAAWQKIEGAVPEADLNLGIAAQEHDREYRSAVGYYHRYLALAHGPRAETVRGWKDRLEQIYGIPEPKTEPKADVPATPVENAPVGQPAAPATPPAPETSR